MRNIMGISLFLLAMLSVPAFADQETGTRARTAAKELQETLKKRLLAAINEKGFGGAVEVCSELAVRIPAEQSKRGKITTLKRVSFKNRNPDNYPDEWEASQLKRMEADNAAGTLNPKGYDATFHEPGKLVYRYMEPIKVAALCLNCHGTPETMDPGAMGAIRRLYPRDRATGYREGDLRGAVSVTIEMKE